MSEDGIYDGTRFETDADELCPFYNRLGRINGTKGRGRCEEEREHGVSENRKWTKNRMRGRQGARRFGEADWRNVENCATPTLGSRNRKKIHWPTSVADPGSNTDAGDPSIKKMLPSKNLKKKKKLVYALHSTVLSPEIPSVAIFFGFLFLIAYCSTYCLDIYTTI